MTMKNLRRWLSLAKATQRKRTAARTRPLHQSVESLETRVLLAGDTVGLFAPQNSRFFLRTDNAPGVANLTFDYGPPSAGWIPLAGDWNGDGSSTVGLFAPDSSSFLLRNANAGGFADEFFNFGPAGAGWMPIVGDWDGDGRDSVGLYNGTAFFLRNQLSGGAADEVFGFGPINSSWLPVAGDWDGDGRDTIGLYNNDAFFLRDQHAGGVADHVFNFGPTNAGWTPIAGDWNADGSDTVGFYSGTTFFLRDALAGGAADVVFNFGPPGANWKPLVGKWDGQLKVNGTMLPGENVTLTGPVFDTSLTTRVVFVDPGNKQLSVTPFSVQPNSVSFVVPNWPEPSQFNIGTRQIGLQVVQDLPGGGQTVKRLLQFGLPQPGINVSPTSGLVTSEDGDSDTFSVVLASPPTANVTIGINSSDTTEGTVSDTTLIFTRTNWDVPRIVTVTGVDDGLTDGDVAYSVVVGIATSADSGYHGLNPPNVGVTNLDNEDSLPGNLLGIFAGTFNFETEFGSNPNDLFDFGNYSHSITVTVTMIVTTGEIGVFDLGGVMSATVTGVATPTQFGGPVQHYQFDVEGEINGATSNNTLMSLAILDDDPNDPLYFSSVIFESPGGAIGPGNASLVGTLDINVSNGTGTGQRPVVIPRIN